MMSLGQAMSSTQLTLPHLRLISAAPRFLTTSSALTLQYRFTVYHKPGVSVARPTSSQLKTELISQLKVAGGKVPLARLMTILSSSTRQEIIQSGKGVEGFFKSISDYVSLATENGKKYAVLKEDCKAPPRPPLEYPPGFICPPLPKKDRERLPTETPRIISKHVAHTDEKWNQLVRVLQRESWFRAGDLYRYLYPAAQVSAPGQISFEKYLSANPGLYYTLLDRDNLYVCLRHPGDPDHPPPFHEGDCGKFFRVHQSSGSLQPHRETKEPAARDHMTLLTYVPLHWTSVGSGIIPREVAVERLGKGVRVTQFLGKHPLYYDLCLKEGSNLHLRRSPLLHYKENGMTRAEAEEYVYTKIDELQANHGESPVWTALKKLTENPLKNPPW